VIEIWRSTIIKVISETTTINFIRNHGCHRLYFHNEKDQENQQYKACDCLELIRQKDKKKWQQRENIKLETSLNKLLLTAEKKRTLQNAANPKL